VAAWAVDFSGRNIQAESGALFPFLVVCNERFDGFQSDKKTREGRNRGEKAMEHGLQFYGKVPRIN